MGIRILSVIVSVRKSGVSERRELTVSYSILQTEVVLKIKKINNNNLVVSINLPD